MIRFSPRKKYIIASLIVSTTFILDQLTKKWATDYLYPNGMVKVINNFFHFVYVQNTGITFGMLRNLPNALQKPLLIALPVVILIFVGYIFYKTQETSCWIALACIIGGAFGNIVDRIRLQYVVDFVYVNVYFMWWPAFNIADTIIVLGMGILSVEVLRGKQLPM